MSRVARPTTMGGDFVTSRRQCHMDDIPEGRKVVLALGAGRHSVGMLLWWVIVLGRHLDAVIFANTGEEPARVYRVVQWVRRFCEARGILFKEVRHKDGNRLADAYTEQEAIPYETQRSCTDNFKLRPQRGFLRSLGWDQIGVVTLIGYAAHEVGRVKDSDLLWSINCYPMVDAGITTADCERFIAEHYDGPPVAISMCMTCPHGGKAWLRETLETSPKNFARYEAMEKNGRNYPKDTLLKKTTLEKLRIEAEQQQKLPMADLSHACMGAPAAGCGT